MSSTESGTSGERRDPSFDPTTVLASASSSGKSARAFDAPITSMPPEKVEKQPPQPSPPILMRLLLGISGLGILVGFFLPWIRQTEIINGAAGGSITNVRMLSGLDLIMRGHLSGTPVAWLLLVPALGLLVACVSMLGFRWSGQLAILSALGLIVYAGYILLRTFIGLTGFGLWLVAGSVGTTILSGVITTMIVRTRADRYKSWEKARK